MTHPIDDDEISRLVRDAAAEWVMPPVRLDAPPWRDRVRGGRARRIDAVQGWLGRLGQAAGGAIALTVGAALIAVYLTGAGKPGPTGSTAASGSSPAPSSGPAASPLPKLFVSGAAPQPSRVLVVTEQGQYAIADLSTGTLGRSFAAADRDSAIVRASNGGLVCVCTTYDRPQFDQPTHATVAVETFDSAQQVTSRTTVLDLSGAPDPRDGQLPADPSHVTVAVSFSPDHRYAYVGWSARAHPDWTSGLVVVDTTDATIVQRLALPNASDGIGDSRTQVDAPRVVGLAQDRVVIDRHQWSLTPATAVDPIFDFSTQVFTAVLSDGRLAAPEPVPAAAGCGEDVTLAGPLPDGGLWLACPRYDGRSTTTIRRLHADGSAAGDTAAGGTVVEGSTAAVSPDGLALYLWNPTDLILHRIDLETGADRTVTAATTSSTSTDALAAIGRWLAPSTLAKTILQPGLVLSPDGTRAYALGILGNPAAAEGAGSAGVLVFDTTGMTLAGRWSPTADFVSLGLSPDGTTVYVVGAPDVDATGARTAGPASITVFDASTGSVRLIAGELGQQVLTFPSPILR